MAKKVKTDQNIFNKMLSNRAAVILLVLIILLFLFALSGYYIAKGNKLDRRSGLVGDAVCGNLVEQQDQDLCCAEGHKGEPTIECVGYWKFDQEEETCGFVCGIPDYENPAPGPLDELTASEDCNIRGGIWNEFPNGCVDSCELARGEISICTQAITFGCDCGPSQCYNFDTGDCEPN